MNSLSERSKAYYINNADLFSQPPLLIFTKGANISGGHCIYTVVAKIIRTLVFSPAKKWF